MKASEIKAGDRVCIQEGAETIEVVEVTIDDSGLNVIGRAEKSGLILCYPGLQLDAEVLPVGREDNFPEGWKEWM
jgi:hypothetical protein